LGYIFDEMTKKQKNTSVNVLGVRNLYRILEKIIQELNKKRFLDKVEYVKCVIDLGIIQKLYDTIKHQFDFEPDSSFPEHMYS
jgi:hypothetical protein